MHPPTSSALTLMGLSPLIAWRFYARVRKMFGRQRLSRYRAPITLVVYSLLSLLVAYAVLAHPGRVWWLVGSLLAGGALSLLGVRHTKFEALRGEGLFYTPNAHLGLVLTVLLVGRIGWRIAEVVWLAPATPRSSAEFMGSSATIFAFGLLAGYSLGYAVALARWRSGVLRVKRERDQAG